MTGTIVNGQLEVNVERLPWAENMIEVSAGTTSEQLLQAAGLDWEVGFQPLYRRPTYIPVTSTNPDTDEQITVMAPNIDGELEEANDVKDVVRVEDGKIFGQVGSDYVLTQNRDAFSFADHLVFNEGGQWVAAGEQYGGKIVFGVMKLVQGTIMVGGEDPIDLYLTIRTSHNGSTGIQAYVTPVRARCENMMGLVVRSAKVKWSVRHVSTLKGKLQEARDTLQLSLHYMNDGLQRELEELINVPMTTERAEWTLNRVIKGSEKRRERVVTAIMGRYEDDTVNGFMGSGYGLLNAVTDYFDHHAPRRNAEVRLQEQYDGEGARARNAVVKELLLVR